MSDFLTQAWEEHSVVFLFFSAVIGGVVGAVVKFVFEALLPDGLKARRESRRTYDKYRNPIARTADSLRSRIGNLLKMHKYRWFESDHYYRISTLYVFCSFLGWKELLFGRTVFLRFEAHRKNRRLSRLLNFVDKALNNRQYFDDLSFPDIPDDTDLPRFVCQALGELMVDPNSKSEEPSLLTFAEFCRRAHADKEFRAWLDILERFLTGVKDGRQNLKWHRLIMVEVSLTGLINFLDPKHEQTAHYPRSKTIGALNYLHRPNTKRKFLTDIFQRRVPLFSFCAIRCYLWLRALPEDPELRPQF